jgi:hypothetical protein
MLDTVEVFHGVFIYFAKQRGFTRGFLNGDGDLGVNARGCFNGFNFNGVLVFRRAVGQGMHRGVLQVVERVLNAEQPRQDDDFDKRRKNPRYVDDAGENPSACGADSRNPTDTTLSTAKWADMQDNPEWMRIMQAPYRAREWVGDLLSLPNNLYYAVYPEAKILDDQITTFQKSFDHGARAEIISALTASVGVAGWRQKQSLGRTLIESPDHTYAFLYECCGYTFSISPGEYSFCNVYVSRASQEIDQFCCADSSELSQMVSTCAHAIRNFHGQLQGIARSAVNERLKAANATTGIAFKPGMFCMVFVGPNSDDNSIHMYFSSIDDLTDNFQARYTEADTTQRQAREARLHPDTARLQGFPPLPARPPAAGGGHVGPARPPPARGRGRGRGR